MHDNSNSMLANVLLYLCSTRSLTPLTHDYIYSNSVNIYYQHTYLKVIIHKSLPWSPHISDILTKASRTLNFIKHDLSKCSSQVKESAYLMMVRPQLEYVSDVWDTHRVIIMELEKYNKYSTAQM